MSEAPNERDLVVANRILAHEGVVDPFGHVSIRDPKDPSRFVIARRLGPELVTESDLQIWTVAKNEQAGGHPGKSYSERAIHASVYAARPDVMTVVHHHSPSVIPFGITGVALRPIMHMAGLLGTDVPIWDVRDGFGDTDMLVRTLEMGASLAKALGRRRVALMRGHGAVVAGATLREVVMCSIYMEHNARLLLQALALGRPITYLSEGEVSGTHRWLLASEAQERAWETWAHRAGAG